MTALQAILFLIGCILVSALSSFLLRSVHKYKTPKLIIQFFMWLCIFSIGQALIALYLVTWLSGEAIMTFNHDDAAYRYNYYLNWLQVCVEYNFAAILSWAIWFHRDKWILAKRHSKK